MKLLTKAVEAMFNKIGKQENVKDPIVVCKFFNAFGPGMWFATQYEAKTGLFYGYVFLYLDGRDGWDYFALDFLESLNDPPRDQVVRETKFKPKPFSKALEEESWLAHKMRTRVKAYDGGIL